MMLKLVDVFGYLSVILRAGTLVFQSLLLGGVLFVLWIARPTSEVAGGNFEKIQSSSLRMLRIAAIGLAVVQALYLYVNSAVLMATAEIGMRDVIGANFFISGSIVFTAAIVAAALARPGSKPAGVWLALLAMVALGASVMTNHAASRMEGRVALVIVSSLHELATGFWIGGLPFLVLGLFVSGDRPTQWYITKRFSRLALISVGIIVATGIGMSLTYIGSLQAAVWDLLWGDGLQPRR